MTELPETSPDVIIKPDNNYKLPLVLVVMVMFVMTAFAGYFYYQTFVLNEQIDALKVEASALNKELSQAESQTDQHSLEYDELVGMINGYFSTVGYDCNTGISECLEQLAILELQETATGSADVAN